MANGDVWNMFAEPMQGAAAGATASPAAGRTPLFQDLKTRWAGFLNQPGNRQAAMQFGLQMMQPRAVGQNFGGQVAQAVGAGMEAKDRHLGIQAQAQAAAQASAMDTAALDIDRQNAETGRMNATTQATYANNAAAGGSQDTFQEWAMSYIGEMMGVQYEPEAAMAIMNEYLSDPARLAEMRQMYNNLQGAGAAPALSGSLPTTAPAAPQPQTPAVGAAGLDPNAAWNTQYPGQTPPEGRTIRGPGGVTFVYRNGSWANG